MDDPTSGSPPPSRASFLRWATVVVHAHRARLLAVARRAGLDPEDALDCVQDAFLTFLCRADAGALAERPDEAGRLLVVLVGNAASNLRRKIARREGPEPTEAPAELASDLPSPDALVARAEAREELVRCVHKLSRMQRAVVRLRLLDEHPGEEVSALLGVSEQNVRILLFRARQRLRECLVLAEDVEPSAPALAARDA